MLFFLNLVSIVCPFALYLQRLPFRFTIYQRSHLNFARAGSFLSNTSPQCPWHHEWIFFKHVINNFSPCTSAASHFHPGADLFRRSILLKTDKCQMLSRELPIVCDCSGTGGFQLGLLPICDGAPSTLPLEIRIQESLPLCSRQTLSTAPTHA